MRRYCLQRPNNFTIDPTHYLARGLVFAGLAPGGMVGSTRYHDSSLCGNHGTLDKTSWLVDPTLGRCAVGAQTYADLGDMACLEGLSAFTVSLWVKVQGADIVSYVKKNNDSGFNLLHKTDTRVYLYVNGQTRRACTGYSRFEVGKWTHLAGTYDGRYSRIWINGAVAATSNRGGTTIPAGGRCYVNRDSVFGAGRHYYADLLIHGRALGEGELRALADPSNVLLSGLILPPKRQIFATYTSTTPTTDYKVYRKMNYYRKLRSF